MMNKQRPLASFTQVIDCWPSLGEFSADIGVGLFTARGWRARSSIPAWHWEKVISRAALRGYPVTPADLIRLAARP